MGCKRSDMTEQLTHFQGSFGNSKKLQFEACSYGVPCTNPTQKWRRKLFYTGMKEIGKARVKKENMLFIG